MKNLDQIRARNALKAAREEAFRGKEGGNIVKKVPTMIRENGLLGAAAFACQNEEASGHAKVFDAIIEHLKSLQRVPDVHMDCHTFIQWLADADAALLRVITAESLAYLNYLRRFAGKERNR